LFKGASFDLSNAGNEKLNVQKILSLPSVKSVQPVRVFSLPETSGYVANQDSALPPSPGPDSLTSTPDTFSPHVMTGVDKLHDEGYFGNGIKVAVVDTGIDYTHPALGGCFGEGCKVGFGADLVGSDYTGTNTPVPGDDLMDCNGHGTHVAGILAADSIAPQFTGVSPNVTVGAYRVFGCLGYTASDVLIKAFMEAYDAGAHVITTSIGVTSGWSEDPWAVAVSRIVEAGVPCTVSVGNGLTGVFEASSASTGLGVTAVGSVDNIVTPALFKNATYFTENDTTPETFHWIPYSPANIPNGTYQLHDIMNGSTDTSILCHDNFTIPNITGKVALVPFTPGCSTGISIVEQVVAAGSKYMLWHSYRATILQHSNATGLGTGIESLGMVTADLGEEWKALIASGDPVYVDMITPKYLDYYVDNTANTESGGYTSYFSSWGPSFEVDVNPQITAPGGNILSTYPLALGAYFVDTGTSMSTPFVAGSIALILEARGELDPATINSILSATATAKTYNDGASTYSYLAPVAQQGAGFVNVYDAVHAVSILNISSISFNDSAHFVDYAAFEIQNTGNESVTYTIDYISTGSVYTLPADGDPMPSESGEGIPLDITTASNATLALTSNTVTIDAGKSASIGVSATLPNLTESRIPVYGGYITINGTNDESLSLPYMGVASSLYDAVIFDTADNLTYLSRYFDVEAVPSGYAFTLPPQNSTDEEKDLYDFPVPVSIDSFGTRVLRLDLAPAYSNSTANTTEVLGEEIVGSVSSYPTIAAGVGEWYDFWYGELSDGTFAPPGDYVFLFRALKVFGNQSAAEDYETVKSVPFSIVYNTTTTSS
jgi:subtilisin family serine protease